MKEFHFYGSSVCEWKTSIDIHEVINHFKKQPEIYSLWLVPVSDSVPYEIRWYQPQVEGSIYLGSFKKGKLSSIHTNN